MIDQNLVVLWNNVLTYYYRGMACPEPIRKQHYFELFGEYLAKVNSKLDAMPEDVKKENIEYLERIR